MLSGVYCQAGDAGRFHFELTVLVDIGSGSMGTQGSHEKNPILTRSYGSPRNSMCYSSEKCDISPTMDSL